MTFKLFKSINENISVSAGTTWMDFVIPEGDWMIFFIIEYIPSSDWFHIRIKNTSTTIIECLGQNNGCSASIATKKFDSNTTCVYTSDGTHANQIFRSKIYGIKFS